MNNIPHYTQNQRKQTLERVAKIMQNNQDSYMRQVAIVMFNLGCTQKKAEEYIKAIEMLYDQEPENEERKDH